MHILGLVNGSIGGNSEILLKAALSAAQEASPSITTSWIHVPSVSFPPNPKALENAPDISLGTIASNSQGGSSSGDNAAQPVRDDRLTVFNAILDADAIIFSTAVYSHQPPGALKALLDTLLGPYTDVTLVKRILAGKKAGDPKYAHMNVDARILKPRTTGFLAVGGSTTPDQFTMALPTLHLFAYGLHVKVVDQVYFMGYANPGAVLRSEGNEAILRAGKLGENVASQIGKTFDEAKYLGPEPEGACPECHLSKLDFFGGKENKIGCVVCGNTGRLVASADGVVRPQWDEESDYCCITIRGKEKHVDDIFKKGSKEWKGLGDDDQFKQTLKTWREKDYGKVNLGS